MTRTVTNPKADTLRSAQTDRDGFSTGLSWKRTTSVLRPAAYGAVVIVLNFLLVTVFSYDFGASIIA